MFNRNVIPRYTTAFARVMAAWALTVALTPCARAVLVTNSNDSGNGSLRQALVDTPDNGVVTFANTLAGQTIYLTNGQLLVTKNLSITAANLPAGIRIDGLGLFRVIQIAASNTVTLDSLRLTNGYAFENDPVNSGGGICVNSGAVLALNNSTVSGSSGLYGGGIYASFATVTVSNSILSANYSQEDGGGIYADVSTLTVNESRLAGNRALYNGGGIADWNTTLTVNNSTLSGNSAGSSGTGGGIYANSSLLLLNRSTLSSNSAFYGGGIGSLYSTLTVNNATFAGNSAGHGGGILLANASTLALNSSTLASMAGDPGSGGMDWVGPP